MRKEYELYLYLLSDHIGREHAVHSRELEKHFDLNARAVRYYINKLRKLGKPICSNESGYWVGRDFTEISMNNNLLRIFMREISNNNLSIIHTSCRSRSFRQIEEEYLMFRNLLPF